MEFNEYLTILAEVRRNVRNNYEVLLKYQYLNMPEKTAYRLVNSKFFKPLKEFCDKFEEPEEYTPVFYDINESLTLEQKNKNCVLAGCETKTKLGVHNFIDDISRISSVCDSISKIDILVRFEPICYDAGVFLELSNDILQ